MITAITLEATMGFLFEKRIEPYRWYGEGSIGEEKSIVGQEPLQSSPDQSGLAGKGGV